MLPALRGDSILYNPGHAGDELSACHSLRSCRASGQSVRATGAAGSHHRRDLLLHRPALRGSPALQTIRELQPGKAATTRGRIVAQGLKTYAKRSKSVFEFVLEDGTGRLHCAGGTCPSWRNTSRRRRSDGLWQVKSIKPRTIDHPETEVIETGDELFIHSTASRRSIRSLKGSRSDSAAD